MQKILNVLYVQLRCGLYHEAALRVVLAPEGAPVEVTIDVATGDVYTVTINPFYFLEAVRAHFVRYVGQLRDPAQKDMRSAFEKEWNRRMGM